MLKVFVVLVIFLQFYSPSSGQNTEIPKGSIKGPYQWKSKIYPGTQRNYWLYIPAQYETSKPACLMVVQDGLSRAIGWRLPTVLDTLIASKEVPVMIGLFIDPGIVPSADSSQFPRFNRSFEYDALGDRYARFLLEELIPEVSRSYQISSNPNDRSIAGASSGAICAFNVAWERPESFRRVFSSIGTYVGLRGAHEFPTLIRKMEAKPLRVFLQDGTRDNNIYAGDWWVANQDMLSALTWAGYEVSHAWGEGGGHDSRHTVTIISDALRWLWKGYPAPIESHTDSIVRINPIKKGQLWHEISLKDVMPQKLAIDQEGNLFLTHDRSIHKYQNGTQRLFATLAGKAGGISFHADSHLYVADVDHNTILSIDKQGLQKTIAKNVHADFLTTTDKGIYFTESEKKKLGFFQFASKQLTHIDLPGKPTGLALTGEQSFLNVGFDNLALGYSFKIMQDGSPVTGQDYVHYHIPYGMVAPQVTGLVTDTANNLFAATPMGIQMSDQLGRINLILSKPASNITDVKIGGTNFNIMYVLANGKLFQRELNTKGVLSWQRATRPPQPRL